jgi:hypothetical protein
LGAGNIHQITSLGHSRLPELFLSHGCFLNEATGFFNSVLGRSPELVMFQDRFSELVMFSEKQAEISLKLSHKKCSQKTIKTISNKTKVLV